MRALAWKAKSMCGKGRLWEQEWPDATLAALTARSAFMQAVREHAGWAIDEDAAQVIYTELITNSIKYGKRPIVARLECDRGGLKLHIEDRGEGFEQGISAPPVQNLTGRGLFLVAKYAEHLEIGGNPRGTSIVATLPRK
jgi:anti-sigma regulatory factor (Ser/Thr protein kinase)